jgi:ankyrin repeat protein
MGHAVIEAAKNSHLRVLKYLDSQGCDPTAHDNEAIQWSATPSKLRIDKYLVSMGCDPTIDNHITLHCAAEYKNCYRMVKYLISQGCDADSLSCESFRSALKGGDLKAIRHLIYQGCIPDYCDLKYCDYSDLTIRSRYLLAWGYEWGNNNISAQSFSQQ